MVFATLSQKRCLKKQTQKHGFSKTPKLPVVDEYLANYKHSWTWSKKPPENKRHTPRGGRRTCYLVVVVVVIVGGGGGGRGLTGGHFANFLPAGREAARAQKSPDRES